MYPSLLIIKNEYHWLCTLMFFFICLFVFCGNWAWKKGNYQKDVRTGKHYSNTATRQADRSTKLMRRMWKTSEKMEHTAALCLQAKHISLSLMPLRADSIKKYTVMMICVLLTLTVGDDSTYST